MVVVAAAGVEVRLAVGAAVVAGHVLGDGELAFAGAAEDGGGLPLGARPRL